MARLTTAMMKTGPRTGNELDRRVDGGQVTHVETKIHVSGGLPPHAITGPSKRGEVMDPEHPAVRAYSIHHGSPIVLTVFGAHAPQFRR